MTPSVLDYAKQDGSHNKRKEYIEPLSTQECLERLVVLLGKDLLEISFKTDAYECYREEYVLEVLGQALVRNAVGTLACKEDAEHD